MQNIPPPNSEQTRHSQRLLSVMKQAISEHDGKLPFSEFMQLALYAPGLGYYHNGLQKFGSLGDFTTAPEISPLFGQCTAKQCLPVLQELSDGEILEFGAGSGILAVDILLALEEKNSLPKAYNILEISAELRQRQQRTLQEKAPHLLDHVQWLDTIPDRFSGIILANEVLDAMPVERILYKDGDILQSVISLQDETLHESWQICSNPSLQQIVKEKLAHLNLSDNTYQTEFNLNIKPWIKSLSQCLQQGLILLIDYGFPEHEYYHSDRHQGTLMCHYRHRSHPDPLTLLGLQDITAHVDFTAVAQAAVNNQLDVAGYTSQASFLISCGITELATMVEEQETNTVQQVKASQQIQQLTSPSEMGELFKVLGLSRNLDSDLIGFKLQDRRARL